MNFTNILKIIRKLGQTLNLPDFRMILNIFGKSIFALKFNIWVLQHPNNMHKNFHKDFITGWKMTAIAKSAKRHPAAKKIVWLGRTCHMNINARASSSPVFWPKSELISQFWVTTFYAWPGMDFSLWVIWVPICQRPVLFEWAGMDFSQ